MLLPRKGTKTREKPLGGIKPVFEIGILMNFGTKDYKHMSRRQLTHVIGTLSYVTGKFTNLAHG